MKFLFSVFSGLLILVSVAFAGEGVIDIAYSPFTISQSGSYIVVKDLTTAQDLNAITVNTSNVTIDLNGHTLYGAGTTVGSNGYGIYANNRDNIAVFNGTIRDFRESGIYLHGSNNQVTRICAYGNRNDGMYLRQNSLALNNIVYQNGATGISITFGGNISGNSVYENGTDGIIGNYGCTITNNSLYNNGGSGITCFESGVITNNSCYWNGEDGVRAGDSSTVIGNSCRYNRKTGITVSTGCTITDNSVNSNYRDGIYVYSSCLVRENTSTGNGFGITTGAGVFAQSTSNVIENNLCAGNDRGLSIKASGNYFAGNRLRANTINIDTVAGNIAGDGTHGFTNIVFYYQPNPVVQMIAGFAIPPLQEMPMREVRNVIW
ncbi:MAG: right-handed parallel beta-helix repeat-containing protein [bacterium]|nr:right-handed parallel beta-helix repeat-containing protein [bacterium]